MGAGTKAAMSGKDGVRTVGAGTERWTYGVRGPSRHGFEVRKMSRNNGIAIDALTRSGEISRACSERREGEYFSHEVRHVTHEQELGASAERYAPSRRGARDH